MPYEVQFSQDHEDIFGQMYVNWYRHTFVFDLSPLGILVDVIFWAAVCLVLLYLPAAAFARRGGIKT